TIHYTTNGSVPTCSSMQYASPITITTSTLIRALACAPGYIPSFLKGYSYKVISSQPVASFTVASDSDSDFWSYTYAGVKLSNASASPVSVNYVVSSTPGVVVSPASGTLNFAPFQTIKAAQIQVKKTVDVTTPQTVTVTLTGANGAVFGATNVYTYTITPY